MTDTSHNPTEPNWDDSIAETPRFKERLPAVFEQLARDINNRAANPTTTQPAPVQRTKTTQRRTGVWRMFAWSTAMAMIMSLVSLLLLHSLVEERVRRDIETQNAAAKEEIALMEREAKERIEEDFSNMRTWLRGEAGLLREGATVFADIAKSDNIPVAALLLYRCAWFSRHGDNIQEVLDRYKIEIEDLRDVEVALLNVNIPGTFEPEHGSLIVDAVEAQLGEQTDDSQ